MLDRLKGIFRTDAFSPTAAVFPSIDATLLASRLSLEKAGSARGKEDQPAAASDALDSLEMQAISSIEEHRRAGIDSFETHRKVYNERLARASEARQEVEIIAGKAKTDFMSAVTVWRNSLANERSDVAAANQSLTEFQTRHRLRRPARPLGNIVLWLGVMAAMIAFESVLNGLLFAERNSFGLVGGAGFALLVSLVNVGVSSAFGWFARFQNHRFWPAKLFGLALIAIWFALAATFNLGVAHFRDAVVVIDGWEAAGEAALASMIADPFGVASLTSWLLVGMGGLISFLSFMKTYGLDDPYPGYGHAERTARAARVAYAEMAETAISTLLEQRDGSIAELRDAQALVATNISGSLDALYGQSAIRANLKMFLEQCDIKVNELLALYRDANNRTRKTPPPPHFFVPYSFPAFEVAEPEVPRKAEAEEQRRQVSVLVERAIKEIFEEFERSLRSHDTIMDIERTRPFGPGMSSAPPRPTGKSEPAFADSDIPALRSGQPRTAGSKSAAKALAVVSETRDGI